jgi:hypothetical protein
LKGNEPSSIGIRAVFFTFVGELFSEALPHRKAGASKTPKKGETKMPLFVIERKIPGSGQFSQDQFKEIAAKSCQVASTLDGYNWHHSYVTDDTWYCIHEAPDAQTVLKHAKLGGFPADRVLEVRKVVNSATGR